jgi:PST family polysaccharide transporter
MKKVFKATVILGGATVIGTFVKIVNTKVIAVFLGPAGVGIFYQLVFFGQLMYLSTSFGTKMGVAKYLSELRARDDHKGIRDIYRACNVSLVLLSILTSTLAFIFAGDISLFLFGTPQYTRYVRFVTVAVPLGVLMDFNHGVLYGFRMVNSIAAFNVTESVLTAAVFLPLVYFLGLNGAIVGIFTTYCIQLALLIFIIKRHSPVSLFLKFFKWAKIKFQSMTKVVRYGSVNLVITFFRDLVLTILFRRLIILHLGIEANGIYAPAYGISLQIFFLIQTAINAYSFSRISEVQDTAEISREVNHLIRTLLLIMVPIIFILIGFRRQVILLLYTDKFLPITAIMPVQFIGDFFKVLVLAISLPIHARADLKGMLSFETGIYLFFYLAARILIPSMGLAGTGWSYLSMYIIYFLVVTPYVVKKFHLRIEGKNIWIMLTSILLLLAGSSLKMSFSGTVLAGFVLLAVWAGVSLTREEWRFGLEKSREYIARIIREL